MNFILVSHSASGAASAPSTISQVVAPSSTTRASNSIRPWTLSSSSSVDCPGARPVSCWEDKVLSQLSRSGPLTVTTPRLERSTTAVPAASARCSRSGSP